MQVQLLSDVHGEFYVDAGKTFLESLDPEGVDVLIVAGDLGLSGTLERSLKVLCGRYPVVIMVAGNHEYYHASFPELQKRVFPHLLGRFQNLHILENDGCILGGQRFLGTTLWFPEDPLNYHFRKALSDFEVISNFSMKVYKQNQKALTFLENNLRAKDIVITHHAPSYESVQEKYRGHVTNRFYVCDRGALILRRQPKFWFHGHMHDPVDYTIGETRIVANPAGYPRREKDVRAGEIDYKPGQLENKNFDPKLLFTV